MAASSSSLASLTATRGRRRFRPMRTLSIRSGLLVLSVAASARASAAPPAPAAAEARPPARGADAILADAIKATGGEAPWKAHRSMETKTEIEYRKMAISATHTQLLTSRNKSLATTDIPNVGLVHEGTNGKVFWAEDPINGLRKLEGAEAAQFRLESTWNVDQHMGELFTKIEAKERTEDGQRLECLEMTPKEGHGRTTCYDPVTHLQVLQKGMAATPQGDVPFTSRIKEWKEFGGMKLPALVEMTTGPIEFSARLTDVVFDKPVNDKIFEMPRAGAKAAKPRAPAATK
jgi:hypothetical protein